MENRNHRKLMGLIGPELADLVCRTMGGQVVRIRKKACTAKEIWESRKEEFSQFGARKLANRLGCSLRYAKMLKAGQR